jgi:hypothetical protein
MVTLITRFRLASIRISPCPPPVHRRHRIASPRSSYEYHPDIGFDDVLQASSACSFLAVAGYEPVLTNEFFPLFFITHSAKRLTKTMPMWRKEK